MGLGAGVFGMTLYFSVFAAPQEPEAPAPPALVQRSPASAADEPVRLRIPSLDIDAHVQHVGVKADGSMGTPSNFTDTAWYKYGTVPGMTGSAVIDGHVDNGLSLPGVFKNLSNIQKGATIEVVAKGGQVARFVVTDVVTYPYKEVPVEQLFNRADKARLNLVTCDGAWVKGARTYDRRLVVYAELAG